MQTPINPNPDVMAEAFPASRAYFSSGEKNCLTYKYPLPTLLKADKFPASEIQNINYIKLYFNYI